MRKLHTPVKIAAINVIGWLVLAVGLVMMVTPGPGLLVIILGLAILAKQYDWAQRLLDRGKTKLRR